MNELEMIEKMERILSLWAEVDFPPMMIQFFDLDSENLLDEKIEVLEALKEGKQISEIPNFYRVLELMPDEGIWD